MKKTTHADFGRATEARFLLDAHRHGLIVSRPFDSARGYDAVVDNGRRLFRVQIKGAHLSDDSDGGASYHISSNPYRSRRIKFDIMAVWLDDHTRWLFLPSEYRRRTTVKLSPYGKHSHRNWDVFLR